MRQTTTRRAPDIVAASGPGMKPARKLGAGDHLDLGMTVSVYRADSVHEAGAQFGAPALNPADADTGFTEH